MNTQNHFPRPRHAILGTLVVAICTCTFALLLLVPSPAVADSTASTTNPVSLDDGTYQVEVTLEGGSGKATVTSPTQLQVTDGQMTATIEWSSPHYDYMLVDGTRYLPTNTQGNSTFGIPVPALDEPVSVIADTTAMSKPHEIAYELTFHTEGFRKQGRIPFPALVACAAGAASALSILLNTRKSGHATRM